MDIFDAGATGGAGIVGVVLGWLGFKSKINGLEKRLDSLSNSVRYEDTCEKTHIAVDQRLTNIEQMQKETRADIKEVLRRLPPGRNNGPE